MHIYAYLSVAKYIVCNIKVNVDFKKALNKKRTKGLKL